MVPLRQEFCNREDTMKLRDLFVAVPALFILGNGAANAGETITDAGATACISERGTRRRSRRATSWSTTRVGA